MTGYQTQQRGLLIAFFESHQDEAFTIDGIAGRMRADMGAAAPSRSTIYRTVADLERENMLQRTYMADQRRSTYKYRGAEACEAHLHVRCEKCNALMHLDEDVSDRIAALLRSNAHVALDIKNSTLLCRCEKCAAETEDERESAPNETDHNHDEVEN